MEKKLEIGPLSVTEKVGYGVGDLASNFYLQFFGLFLLYYYTDVFGLDPAAVGLMLLLSKIVDAFSDPIMGLIADRTDSRWGKYRPWLIWAAIPYGIFGYLMFHGPELSDAGRLAWAYATYILVMLAFTAINVPYSALLGVISPLAEERTKATTYRFFFATMATIIIGAVVTPLKNFLGGGDEVLGFRLTMALFALVSVVLFVITFATTRERIEPEHHESSIKEDFGALLQNLSWLMLIGTGIFIITGWMVRLTSIVYYMKYYAGDDGATVFLFFDASALILTMGAVGQLIGVMITEYLSEHFDKHRLIIAMCWIHVVMLGVFYVIPPDNLPLMVIVHMIGMGTFGPTIALLFAMYTDCAEYGEWKTGKRTTGLIVSASLFSLKFGSALGGALPGFVLASVGFVANEVQTEVATSGIRLMFCAIPAVLIFIGSIFMFWYQLDRKFLWQMEADMYKRRHPDAKGDEVHALATPHLD